MVLPSHPRAHPYHQTFIFLAEGKDVDATNLKQSVHHKVCGITSAYKMQQNVLDKSAYLSLLCYQDCLLPFLHCPDKYSFKV